MLEKKQPKPGKIIIHLPTKSWIIAARKVFINIIQEENFERKTLPEAQRTQSIDSIT